MPTRERCQFGKKMVPKTRTKEKMPCVLYYVLGDANGKVSDTKPDSRKLPSSYDQDINSRRKIKGDHFSESHEEESALAMSKNPPGLSKRGAPAKHISKRLSIHANDARHLFIRIRDNLPHWGDLSGDTVMDVGLGPERNCCALLVTLYPKVKKVVSIDKYPLNVEKARKMSPHPKVDYEVANIWDSFALEKWNGTIDKIVSVNCFNSVYDQLLAFQNAWRLLKPGGEGAFTFNLRSGFFDWFQDLAENPKWRHYYDGKSQFIPPSHENDYSHEYYDCLLQAAGFEVLFCEEKEFAHSYTSDEAITESAAKACVFNVEIPHHLLPDFKKDAFEAFLRHNKRDKEGRPCLEYLSCTILVRKPKDQTP